MAHGPSHTVPETDHGLRLDLFLARAAGCGVRTAKRLAGEGRVLVDGKARPALFRLAAGAVVTVTCAHGVSRETAPVIVARGAGYVAFDKPAGLHTAAIAGARTASLEHGVREHWAFLRAAAPAAPVSVPESLVPFFGGHMERPHLSDGNPLPEAVPELLTRLDALTSGIVLAATSPAAAQRFRVMEAAGKVSKYYLAVVRGTVSSPFVVRNALDTDNRKKSRVMDGDSTDSTRHSEIVPVGDARALAVPGAPDGATLAAVRIKRGARHQIRAHLAHAGYPILGDTVYNIENEGYPLYLHHALLVFPSFHAFRLPPWFPV